MRWVVLLAWVAAAVALTVLAPYKPDTTGSNFGDLLPADSAVFKVEQRILEEFRIPLLSGTTVVVHQEGGLSVLTRADSFLWALATTQDTLQSGGAPKPNTIAAAIPVPTGRAVSPSPTSTSPLAQACTMRSSSPTVTPRTSTTSPKSARTSQVLSQPKLPSSGTWTRV